MPRKDEIPATGDMPQPPVRRIDATEKARQMMQPVPPPTPSPVEEGGGSEEATVRKLTTRIPLEQFNWLKEEIKQYKRRNPKAARMTVEGLMMVAIDHLKDTKNLDSIISKYRN